MHNVWAVMLVGLLLVGMVTFPDIGYNAACCGIGCSIALNVAGELVTYSNDAVLLPLGEG